MFDGAGGGDGDALGLGDSGLLELDEELGDLGDVIVSGFDEPLSVFTTLAGLGLTLGHLSLPRNAVAADPPKDCQVGRWTLVRCGPATFRNGITHPHTSFDRKVVIQTVLQRGEVTGRWVRWRLELGSMERFASVMNRSLALV